MIRKKYLVIGDWSQSRTTVKLSRTPMVFYRSLFELVLSPLEIPLIAKKTHIYGLREIFLSNVNVCCAYLLESSHRGDSNKYTQHTIIL